MSNYSDMIARYKELYNLNETNSTDWQKTLAVTEGKPIEAYRQFESLSDAQILIEGDTAYDETFYDVYPGALISVINDASVENNGLYHVVYNDSEEQGHPLYKLEKYYNAATVDTLISGIQPGSGEMHFTNADMMDDSQSKGHLIYFTGVSDMDCSANTKECDSSNMLFTTNIGYDTTGTLFTAAQVSASDVRLKDHIEELDVDLGKVGEIDKIKFTWKDNMNGKRHIGTTAQSLETAFPELVYTNPETGYKAVNYEGLSVIALAAIDKLYARVRDLENIVRKLTKEQQ